MDYGERFNYGKIKDDFDCPNPNGYYSSTHTSSDLDSTFNPISSLDDLQEEYPDKFITYCRGKGNKFFSTYRINKFGEFELLDTNWHHSMSMSNKELEEENKRLKEHIILLEEKNDVLEKCNETITKESKENKKKTLEKSKENERKAKAFDKIYKLLYSKFTCETNYKDIYGGGKNGPIKVGQWLEGCMLKQPKLTDKETIKLLNLLLMGMGSDYYVQLNGDIGLDDKDDGKRSL